MSIYIVYLSKDQKSSTWVSVNILVNNYILDIKITLVIGSVNLFVLKFFYSDIKDIVI